MNIPIQPHTALWRPRRTPLYLVYLAAFCGASLGFAAVAPTAAHAQTTFTATLTGAQETPSNGSAGTGFGFVSLNAAQTLITVDLSFSGLSGPATASHIHSPGGLGVSAAVLFPFTGVPAATSGSIPEQTFAITPAQVVQLQTGLMYFNVHTGNVPAGEIRGQILPAAIPEASTTASFGLLLLLGLGGIVLAAKRRKAA